MYAGEEWATTCVRRGCGRRSEGARCRVRTADSRPSRRPTRPLRRGGRELYVIHWRTASTYGGLCCGGGDWKRRRRRLSGLPPPIMRLVTSRSSPRGDRHRCPRPGTPTVCQPFCGQQNLFFPEPSSQPLWSLRRTSVRKESELDGLMSLPSIEHMVAIMCIVFARAYGTTGP